MDMKNFSLDELMENLLDNVTKDTKSFEDIVNLEGCVSREIYVGDISEGTGSTVDGYIRFWNHYDDRNKIPKEKREPIKIYINSQGGSLLETFIMINSINMSKTPVWTICTGAAYSGGFFTFIAGDRRLAYPQASFLYHEGSVGSSSADASKFRNFADFYSKQLAQLKEIVLKHTKISAELYDEHIKDDWWFTAKEAIKYGICDEISERFV